MVRRWIALFLLLLLWLLSACNQPEQVGVVPTSSPHATAASSFTAVPTATENAPNPTTTPLPTTTIPPTLSSTSSTPTHTPNPLPTPTITPVVTSLEGPLLAFYFQPTDQTEGEFSLLLFDVGTKTFRHIRNDLVNHPFEPQWFGNGCHLFIRGRLLDLHGNTVWEMPGLVERGWQEAGFGGTRLSPNQEWLAYHVGSGLPGSNSAEFEDVETINLNTLDPPIRLSQHGVAYAPPAWSADSQWLTFSDLDENGVLQIYRATPDGRTIQPLTNHSELVGRVETLAWSPDGRYLAYLVNPVVEGVLAPGQESWVGLISLDNQQSQPIRIEDFRYGWELRWSSDNTRFAVVGEGDSSQEPPYFETQIHWIDATTGTLAHSFYASEGPADSFGRTFSLGLPAGNIDTFLLSGRDGFYLLHAPDNSLEFLGNFEIDGLYFGIVSSPFDFPGEDQCQPLN
jgi:hypothetical protein